MYLDEVTQADWTDTQVNREINASYMEMFTAVVTVFEDYYSVKARTATVTDQQEYALPSDFYKIRRVEVNYAPSNAAANPYRVKPVSLDQILRDLGNTYEGINMARNPCYYIRGNNIGLIPIPTDGGSTAFTLWYIKVISELSEDTDAINIPFPDRYGPLIALGAAGSLLRKGQQEEAVALRYLQEFRNGLLKMQAELEDRIADDAKSVIDTQGDDVDFSYGL